MNNIMSFYKNKRVLITGHTGFKGSWLAKILTIAGAEITGYSLEPTTTPNLFDICNANINTVIGDIRNFDKLLSVIKAVKPEIIFHLAAQPIVLLGYKSPHYTYETNVMGTVNLLESIRLTDSVQSALNVTTDKVYKNNEWMWGYRESDVLDGFDPYSNSKSCSELISNSYSNAFFKERRIPMSTARAGNVIGGGDFAPYRIIPDCIYAATNGEEILVRNPYSVRPYQHVLEPLYAYLFIVMEQYYKKDLGGCYNIGPGDEDCINTETLVKLFCKHWGGGISWKGQKCEGVHEASYLKLDTGKIRNTFGLKPVYNIDMAVQKTVEWTKEYLEGKNISICMERQICEYFKLVKHI